MSNKLDTRIITEKRKLWISYGMMLSGGAGALFFGLALIGFAISPNLLDHLSAAIVTTAIFGGSALLIRGGIRKRREYRNGKEWSEPPNSFSNAKVTSEDVPNRDTSVEQQYKCASCGAIGTADENGCCEYCGTQLSK